MGVAPGGMLPLHVTYRNRGATTALSPTLQLNLSPGLHYLGDSSGLTPTLTGTQLSWPLPNLASMEHGDITLLLEVLSGALGSRISLQLAIESAGPEASSGDNQAASEIWLPLAGADSKTQRAERLDPRVVVNQDVFHMEKTL